MKFTKMHGCGNDYVYVNGFEETVQNPEKTAGGLFHGHVQRRWIQREDVRKRNPLRGEVCL